MGGGGERRTKSRVREKIENGRGEKDENGKAKKGEENGKELRKKGSNVYLYVNRP